MVCIGLADFVNCLISEGEEGMFESWFCGLWMVRETDGEIIEFPWEAERRFDHGSAIPCVGKEELVGKSCIFDVDAVDILRVEGWLGGCGFRFLPLVVGWAIISVCAAWAAIDAVLFFGFFGEVHGGGYVIVCVCCVCSCLSCDIVPFFEWLVALDGVVGLSFLRKRMNRRQIYI